MKTIPTLMILMGIFLIYCGYENFSPIDYIKDVASGAFKGGNIGDNLRSAIQEAKAKAQQQQAGGTESFSAAPKTTTGGGNTSSGSSPVAV